VVVVGTSRSNRPINRPCAEPATGLRPRTNAIPRARARTRMRSPAGSSAWFCMRVDTLSRTLDYPRSFGERTRGKKEKPLSLEGGVDPVRPSKKVRACRKLRGCRRRRDITSDPTDNKLSESTFAFRLVLASPRVSDGLSKSLATISDKKTGTREPREFHRSDCRLREIDGTGAHGRETAGSG